MRLVAATIVGFALLVAAAHAGEVHVGGHRIVFTAAAGEANSVHVEYRDDDVDVADDQPLTAGAGCTQVSPTEATCPPAPLRLDLGDGNDEGYVRCDSLCGPAVMHGGAGNDLLSADQRGDVLDGGAGDDELQGGGGPDLLRGGPGDDLLSPGFGPTSTVSCGSGSDTFLIGARPTVTADCEAFDDTPWGRTTMRIVGDELVLVARRVRCPISWILGMHQHVVRAVPDATGTARAVVPLPRTGGPLPNLAARQPCSPYQRFTGLFRMHDPLYTPSH